VTTPAPDDVPPAEAHQRRGLVVGAVVAVLLLLVAAVLVRVWPGSTACLVVGDGPPRLPAVVAEGAQRVHDALGDRQVTLTCVLAGEATGDPDDGARAADPAAWRVDVEVRVEREDVVATARALLAVTHADAPFGWDPSVGDVARSLTVVLTPGGDVTPAQDAVALREVPGVAEVWLSPDGGLVSVATGADVAAAVAATAGRALPATTVETMDEFVEVRQVNAGSWPDPVAITTALDVARWDGVWHVVVSGGEPADDRLDIGVGDDAQRALVVSRLDALLTGASRVIGYQVDSPAGGVAGVVGGAVGAPSGSDATAVPVPDPAAAGLPACAGADLTVAVMWTDAAAGSRFMGLRATSTAAAPCTVTGVPTLAFTRASGTLTPDLTQLSDVSAPDVPPTVVLAPGEAVDAEVRWAAMSTSQDPDVAVRVSVRAVPGAPVADLVLPTSLDVLAGATVRVGPWRPAQDVDPTL
jgi:hypothetical protein